MQWDHEKGAGPKEFDWSDTKAGPQTPLTPHRTRSTDLEEVKFHISPPAPRSRGGFIFAGLGERGRREDTPPHSPGANDHELSNGINGPSSPGGTEYSPAHMQALGMVGDQYVMAERNRVAAQLQQRLKRDERKMGTLKGVFLPCLQNIMGVILFIRLPYIVGQAGIWVTLLIILLCKTTTTLTTLSMSAIATNGTVQAGGPYYMISRNLGVGIGGAIGTLFYVGTTIASSMYVLGAVETMQTASTHMRDATFGSQGLSIFFVSIITLTVYIGQKYVNMSAAVFLGVVFFSIISIVFGTLLFAGGVYTGHLNSSDGVPFDNWLPVYVEDPDTGITPSFFTLTALFFPSATGIMAGCNRSAVLKDPSKSIPKGTLYAIAATSILYLVFVLLFGCVMANDTLIRDKMVEMRIAWPVPGLVAFGIVAASLGAAMQCVTGAANLIAAIAMDRTIPFLTPLAPKPDQPPTKAVLLTGLLAAFPCLAGNLDYITAPITIMYLLTYCSVNLSCFVLSILQSPGFRPKWRYYSWHTALLGVIFCIMLMFIVSIQAAILCIFLGFGLLFYIKYQNATRDWGDTLTGLRYQIARDVLMALSLKEMHAKNWRPQVLVLCDVDEGGNPKVPELLSLSGQMKMGRGLLMVAALIKSNGTESILAAAEAQRVLSLHLRDEQIEGFCRVSVCEDNVDAAITCMHHTGIGTLQPNSVLLSWPDDWSKHTEKGGAFVKLLRGAVRANKAVMVLKGAQALPMRYDRLTLGETIDIWWVAHDGGLLLLLPYLLSLHVVWRRCQLRLFSVIVDPTADTETVRRDIEEYLTQVRIEASVTCIDMSNADLSMQLYGEHMDSRAREEAMCNMGLREVTIDNMRGFSHGRGGDGSMHNIRRDAEELEADNGDHINHDDNDEEEVELSPQPRVSESGNGSSLPLPLPKFDQISYKTAVLLNLQIKTRSDRARLIVTNLPKVMGMKELEVLEYVEALSDGVSPVLMIRGTGAEVVTAFG